VKRLEERTPKHVIKTRKYSGWSKPTKGEQELSFAEGSEIRSNKRKLRAKKERNAWGLRNRSRGKNGDCGGNWASAEEAERKNSVEHQAPSKEVKTRRWGSTCRETYSGATS